MRTLKKGILHNDGKPLECPFKSRVLVPGPVTNSLTLQVPACGIHCPLFVVSPVPEPEPEDFKDSLEYQRTLLHLREHPQAVVSFHCSSQYWDETVLVEKDEEKTKPHLVRSN